MNAGDQAEQLAVSGKIDDALRLLGQAAQGGDARAIFTLAVWTLTGRYVPRSFPNARELFRGAAVSGLKEAAVIYANFVATGVGAPADWKRGLEMLDVLAQSDTAAAQQRGLIAKMTLTAAGDPATMPAGERLRDSPELTLFRGLFTPEESNYLAEAATPRLRPAVVVDDKTGKQVPHPVRTSESAGFPAPLENPAVHALNRRIAAASATDVAQGEPLQVLRYQPGQEYKPHLDAIPGFANQRILTMLVYLNNDYEGGETSFPRARLKVKGKKGDGLLFRNVDAAGRCDEMSGHAGLPVTKGVKLLASRWIRARPYEE